MKRFYPTMIKPTEDRLSKRARRSLSQAQQYTNQTMIKLKNEPANRIIHVGLFTCAFMSM
jgi:hypothetical protein